MRPRLPYVYDMATRNVENVAKHQQLRVSRDFPETAQLLVNVGLLMRAVQQDTGPRLWAAIPDDRLEIVRARWRSPMHWSGTS